METVTLTEARRRLSQLARATNKGEHTLITLHGKPAAVIVSIAEYEQLAELTSWKETVSALDAGLNETDLEWLDHDETVERPEPATAGGELRDGATT